MIPQDKENIRNISQIVNSEILSIPSLDEQGWNDLLEFARKQGVLCYIYYALKQKNAENVLPEAWKSMIKLQLLHFSTGNIKHLLELEEISLLFEKAQAPVVFLKGSHLAFHVYPYPSLRPMGDIDIVVSYENIQKTIDTLLDSGYQSDYFIVEYVQKYHWHFPPFKKERKKTIELHWTLIQPKLHTTETEEIMQWLFTETEEKQFGSSKALVFKPDALVFQLMLHYGLNDDINPSLKNLLDITVAIQKHKNEINWEVITGKILETCFVRRFVLIGWLARNTVGANIPDYFFQKLNVKLTEEVTDLALNRIFHFSEVDFLGKHTDLYNANLTQKMIIMLTNLFPSPSRLKYRYNLKNNWEALFYYPKRVFDLVTTYNSDVIRTLKPNEAEIAKTKEEIILVDWLEGHL
jgi:Uncharacterised nucleotidyltransferase